MGKEYVNWYGKCVESLFIGNKDSWVCRKVVELSAGVEKESKEEIIKDTKFRFRALLDYTLDVFTGDRMENKSYQLPFAMYYVARCMFQESVAAIASEAIMSVANWDYRVRSNILRFILLDDNPEECFLEKMTIFFMALEETKALENTHVSDCSGMSFAEFYPEIVGEIEHLDYEYVKRTLESIRSSNKRYYLTYNHALWKANEYRIPEHLRALYAKCERDKSKYSHEGLDKTLVDFIKMDMYEYINKGYVGSYSPFWIFGSMKYKQNIDFIFSRKHTIEFDSAWIHYLSIR
ncbi:MAG: hypothetical protein IJ419_10175, partial [Agathobacter sp.]|nr:hypothetical protein [Agathobacter sp.]